MALHTMTAFVLMVVFIMMISVKTNRDTAELIWQPLKKCAENMREFALKGVFVSTKLGLLYICICWAMLGIWTCRVTRVTNTKTNVVMSIEDYYADRTIESKIEVPLMVYTWMRNMIYISGVHVLFVHWWGE